MPVWPAPDEQISLELLLFWLQQASRDAGRDFRRYEPAMARLTPRRHALHPHSH